MARKRPEAGKRLHGLKAELEERLSTAIGALRDAAQAAMLVVTGILMLLFAVPGLPGVPALAVWPFIQACFGTILLIAGSWNWRAIRHRIDDSRHALDARLSDVEKGADSERHVGRLIGATLRRTAVAHGLPPRTIPGQAPGDIDHLVAMPAGLRVVETKTDRIPNKRYRRELDRIAENVLAVRKWANTQHVEGWLVFNGWSHPKPPGRTGWSSKHTMKIRVFKDADQLARELDGLQEQKRCVRQAVVDLVWELDREE